MYWYNTIFLVYYTYKEINIVYRCVQVGPDYLFKRSEVLNWCKSHNMSQKSHVLEVSANTTESQAALLTRIVDSQQQAAVVLSLTELHYSLLTLYSNAPTKSKADQAKKRDFFARCSNVQKLKEGVEALKFYDASASSSSSTSSTSSSSSVSTTALDRSSDVRTTTFGVGHEGHQSASKPLEDPATCTPQNVGSDDDGDLDSNAGDDAAQAQKSVMSSQILLTPTDDELASVAAAEKLQV